jgi:hypothetical protein
VGSISTGLLVYGSLGFIMKSPELEKVFQITLEGVRKK